MDARTRRFAWLKFRSPTPHSQPRDTRISSAHVHWPVHNGRRTPALRKGRRPLLSFTLCIAASRHGIAAGYSFLGAEVRAGSFGAEALHALVRIRTLGNGLGAALPQQMSRIQSRPCHDKSKLNSITNNSQNLTYLIALTPRSAASCSPSSPVDPTDHDNESLHWDVFHDDASDKPTSPRFIHQSQAGHSPGCAGINPTCPSPLALCPIVRGPLSKSIRSRARARIGNGFSGHEEARRKAHSRCRGGP